ncbi:hypothetical protein ACQPZG_22530 [Streptomyces sp. CA-294286]|uniref:hypothetical protein n=1 Tax=Streptomyces sp. CA-294286 TaxID=3240070 RepID=UPI003D90BCF0
MSPTASSALFAAAESTYRDSVDERFALLLARTGLDAELGRRFAEDPLSVLVEHGLPAAGTEARPDAAVLTVEELDRTDSPAMLLPTWRCRADGPKPVQTPVESK